MKNFNLCSNLKPGITIMSFGFFKKTFVDNDYKLKMWWYEKDIS